MSEIDKYLDVRMMITEAVPDAYDICFAAGHFCFETTRSPQQVTAALADKGWRVTDRSFETREYTIYIEQSSLVDDHVADAGEMVTDDLIDERMDAPPLAQYSTTITIGTRKAKLSANPIETAWLNGDYAAIVSMFDEQAAELDAERAARARAEAKAAEVYQAAIRERNEAEADAAAMREHLLEINALYEDVMESKGATERGALGQRTAELLAANAGAALLERLATLEAALEEIRSEALPLKRSGLSCRNILGICKRTAAALKGEAE